MNKIDKDKQYKTRDGREVRIYATDGAGSYPIQGATKLRDGWYLAQWHSEGRHLGSHESPNDLIEVKPRMKFERWYVINRNGDYSIWQSKPDASSRLDTFAIKQVVFEVEEGEGLEHGSN